MGRKQNQTSQSGLWIDLMGSKSDEDITKNRPEIDQNWANKCSKVWKK